MMTAMKRMVPIGIALFLLLSACSGQDRNESPDKPTGSEQPTIQQPNSEMYSLNGTDAVIFDAVSQFVNGNSAQSDVCIPMLDLVGEYENDNGNDCYILKCHLYIYFDLQDVLNGVSEQTDLLPGEEISWVCVTLSDDGGLVDLLKSQDGDTWAESVIKLCGPLSDLANDIISNTAPDTIRTFPDVDQEQLVQAYVESVG